MFVSALTVLTIYMVGVSLMTSQVTYPLYAAVPADAFVAYHRRYSSRIPLVIIAPGIVSFLACVAVPFVRPDAVPAGAAVVIAAGGLTALTATVGAAIPSHRRLQRDGFDRRAYRTLRRADRIRTAGCLASATTLVWCVLPAVA
jgi:hypothetical protein